MQGLCAKVLLLGCVRVRSLVKVGDTLKVQAGTFTSKTPLKPIQARAGPVARDATGSRPRPVQTSRLLDLLQLDSADRIHGLDTWQISQLRHVVQRGSNRQSIPQ